MTVKDKLGRILKRRKKDEVEIPAAWLEQTTEAPIENVEPSIIIEEKPERRFKMAIPRPSLPSILIRLPGPLLLKRVIAFLLLALDLSAILAEVPEFHLDLLFYIPMAYILLDYLLRTRRKREKWNWPSLEDVEG